MKLFFGLKIVGASFLVAFPAAIAADPASSLRSRQLDKGPPDGEFFPGEGHGPPNGVVPIGADNIVMVEYDEDGNPKMSKEEMVEKYKGKGVYIVPKDIPEDMLDKIKTEPQLPDLASIPSIDDLPKDEYQEVVVSLSDGDGGNRLLEKENQKHDFTPDSRDLTISVPYWTTYVSDGWGDADCGYDSPNAASGVGCRGPYCDDVRLRCSYKFGYGSFLHYLTGWVSEEYPNTLICPNDYYVSEVLCRGSYCDQLSFLCKRLPGYSRTDCWWGGWYSEENAGRYSSDHHLAGIQCSGPFCDNKRNLYCD